MTHKCSNKCYFREIKEHSFQCQSSLMIHDCYENCSHQFVNSDGTVTCLLTGQCFQQMLQQHPFALVPKNIPLISTNPSLKRKRERNPFKAGKIVDFALYTRKVLEDVLYSQVREERNNIRLKDAKRQTNREMKSYLKLCTEQGVSPRKKKLEEILSANQPKILSIQEKNSVKIREYVQKILNVWKLMSMSEYAKDHKSIIHFNEFMIGLLYIMRKGIIFHQCHIQKDPFLLHMLPPIQELKHYGISIKSVTNGKKIIKSSFQFYKPKKQKH